MDILDSDIIFLTGGEDRDGEEENGDSEEDE